jgi:hypothetical protein
LFRSITMRLLLVTALALGVTVAPASFARVAANTSTFQDATGENPDGIDVTSVRVSNNDEGLLTFRINIPTRPAFTEDMRLRVWFDSDYNRQTGLTSTDVAGRDSFILWDRDGVRLFRCGGSSCRSGQPQRTLGSSYRGGATLTINAAELETTRFRFMVEAAAGIGYDPGTRTFDPRKATWDFAPERAQFWSYNVRLGPSRLLVKSFSTTPTRPQAGKRLSVRVTATRNDTGALLSSGRVTCAARIGAKPLKPSSQRFVGSRATCVFASIPPSAKGQKLRGSIAIAFEGTQVRRSFSRRIG